MSSQYPAWNAFLLESTLDRPRQRIETDEYDEIIICEHSTSECDKPLNFRLNEASLYRLHREGTEHRCGTFRMSGVQGLLDAFLV